MLLFASSHLEDMKVANPPTQPKVKNRKPLHLLLTLNYSEGFNHLKGQKNSISNFLAYYKLKRQNMCTLET